MKKILANFLQAHGLFVIIALITGLGFIVITPPFWGADEGQHFIRAYQISHGEFSQRHVSLNGVQSLAGEIPKPFALLDKLRASDISDAVPGETRQVDSRDAYSKIVHSQVNKSSLVANPYGKIIYSPLVYVAPSSAMFVSHFFDNSTQALLFSARFATLLLYISLAALAIYMLRKSAIKWLVFTIALLPMSVFQASVVSPDSLVLGLSLIYFSALYTMLYIDKKLGNKQATILAISAVFMTLVKMPYVLLVFGLLMVRLPAGLTGRKKLFVKVGIPLGCVVAVMLALATARGAIATPLPNIDSAGQLHWLLTHPMQYSHTLVSSISILNWVPQIIGLFGSSFVFIPGIIFQVLLVALALLAYAETERPNNKLPAADRPTAILYLLLSLLTALAIVTILFLTWTPVGANLVQGIQGRYFLPLVAFFMLGTRKLTNARLVVSEVTLRLCCVTLASLALSASLAWYFQILY